MTTSPTPQAALPPVNKGRLEMLFDGVFAIAMTILVIEIRVPDLVDHRSVRELADALLRNGPAFVSYAVSFAMLGLFWLDAQRQFHRIERITPGLLGVNLFLMATAAFFPFCAALLGRYATNPVTMVVYLGDILLYRLGLLAQWRLAERGALIDDRMDPLMAARFRARNFRAATLLVVLWSFFFAICLVRP